MKRLLILILLCAPLVRADRNWFIIPDSKMDTVKQSIPFQTSIYDTVWRDSSWTVKGAQGQDSTASNHKLKVVRRVAGGYVVAGSYKVDTLHTLYAVMIYTSHARMTIMAADTTILVLQTVDSTMTAGAIPALKLAAIKRFCIRNGFKSTAVNAQDWSSWAAFRATIIKVLGIKKNDIDGSDVSNRDN